LGSIGSHNGADISLGSADDGSEQLTAYLQQAVGEERWATAPVVSFGGDVTPDNRDRALRAIQMVNTALPEHLRIRVGSEGSVSLNFLTERGEDVCSCWGVTYSDFTAIGTFPWANISGGRIDIYQDYSDQGDRNATILLAHELMHVLGVNGGDNGSHTRGDIDSIMGGGSEAYRPGPASVLHPVDREALRFMYSAEDLGLWSTSSEHLVGETRYTKFGVVSRNGYFEPWAQGVEPSSQFQGSATWSGAFVGWTSSRNAVVGTANIRVDMGTLSGTAAFTQLDIQGSDRTLEDLEYLLRMEGNTFHEAGGDAGRLTGALVGRNHEGVLGTLERDDLTGSFGADRSY